MESLMLLFVPLMPQFALSSTPANSGSLENVLAAATKLLTWMITSMGSYLDFVTSNPVVLMMFMLLLIGAGISFLMRIWHSA